MALDLVIPAVLLLGAKPGRSPGKEAARVRRGAGGLSWLPGSALQPQASNGVSLSVWGDSNFRLDGPSCSF